MQILEGHPNPKPCMHTLDTRPDINHRCTTHANPGIKSQPETPVAKPQEPTKPVSHLDSDVSRRQLRAEVLGFSFQNRVSFAASSTQETNKHKLLIDYASQDSNTNSVIV